MAEAIKLQLAQMLEQQRNSLLKQQIAVQMFLQLDIGLRPKCDTRIQIVKVLLSKRMSSPLSTYRGTPYFLLYHTSYAISTIPR